MEGRRIGRYRITSKQAEGGMGAVYLATHALMGREVVIKVLLPEMSTQRDVVQRFFNEARATANLEHPGIVAIFDREYADDGRAYIMMERLRGESLHERLRRVGRVSVEQCVDVARQLASAIGAAHAQGIVHRDLKPGNIFLVPDRETPGRERVKVLDFGVAKLALHQSSLGHASGDDLRHAPVHGPGTVRGCSHGRSPRRSLRGRLHPVRVPVRPAAVRRQHHRGAGGAAPRRAGAAADAESRGATLAGQPGHAPPRKGARPSHPVLHGAARNARRRDARDARDAIVGRGVGPEGIRAGNGGGVASRPGAGADHGLHSGQRGRDPHGSGAASVACGSG
jgi:serine/threonine protein kinase